MKHFLLILLSVSVFTLSAQQQPLVPSLSDGNNMINVEFSAYGEEDEMREAYFTGTTENEPLKFSIQGLGYALYPVTVTLIGKDPDRPVSMAFVKKHWGDSLSVTDTEDGPLQENFQTAREFGIVVHAEEPGTEFALAIWVGPEIMPQAGKVFYPVSEYEEDGSAAAGPATTAANEDAEEESDILLYVIIGLLALLIIVGLLIFVRMNKKATILLLLMSSPMLLQAGAKPVTEEMYEMWKELANLTEELRDLRDKIETFKEGYEKWKKLDETDEDFEYEQDPRDQPRMPSSCILAWENASNPRTSSEADEEKADACDCLEEAYADFNRTRYLLGKLRNIYTSTKKVSEWAISFGDNLAPSTGHAAIAWRQERDKIEASTEELEKAYDQKLEEYIDALYDDLIAIDGCEAQLGFENWYSRVGFIYFEFTKERYRR